MKTISDYTVYCTDEQTNRAYKLGTPLEKLSENILRFPTTQQMIGWLEDEKGISVQVTSHRGVWTGWVNQIEDDKLIYSSLPKFTTRQEAELDAIDSALDYLEKENQENNK